MSGERTEKPTPKRRNEAKKKGQVARSNDVNGAVVMFASLMALGSFGPKLAQIYGQGVSPPSERLQSRLQSAFPTALPEAFTPGHL